MNITLPARFWNDHAERGLPSGQYVRKQGTYVVVNVTKEELAEILSDAQYYGWDVDCAPHSLIRSARTTCEFIKDAYKRLGIPYPRRT